MTCSTIHLCFDAATITAAEADRTLSGLALPWGVPVGLGVRSGVFTRGSLRWSDDVSRVKLLRDHDHTDPIGFATSLADTDTGILATFTVAPGESGDRALADAAARTRDGLSVGVWLDDDCLEALWDEDTGDQPVTLTGVIREISQCAIPAFDDARLAASLLNDPPQPPTRKAHRMDPTTPEAAPALTATPEAQAMLAAPAPAAPLATLSVSEPLTYRFDGQVGSPSLAKDLYAASADRDSGAAERVSRFTRQLADHRLDFATSTIADLLGVVRNSFRPDLAPAPVDSGRVLIDHLHHIPIQDATPFDIPVFTEMDAVADHTEGSAVAGAGGAIVVTTMTVTPRAVSGYFDLSRELVESSNPAIDTIMLDAMLRDYRRKTEAKAQQAVKERAGIFPGAFPAEPTGPGTIDVLREASVDFLDVRHEVPDWIMVSALTAKLALGAKDDIGRPLLPTLAPSNAVGVSRAGWTGADIGGIDLVRVPGLSSDHLALVGISDNALWFESAVRDFRFEEQQGPGVIRVALFAYCAAAVTDHTSIRQLTK